MGHLYLYTLKRGYGPEGEENESADPASTVVRTKIEPDKKVDWESTCIMAHGVLVSCMDGYICGAPFRNSSPSAQIGLSNGLVQTQ